MTNHSEFWRAVWLQNRPRAQALATEAIAQLIDFSWYLALWVWVLGAHLVRLFFAKIGLDPEIVSDVAFMERWTFIASFASFFILVFMRLWETTFKRSDR